MTIPSFATAGAGATANAGGSASTAYPASLVAGDLLICHTLTLASDTGYSGANLLSAGFELDADKDVTFSTTNRSRVYLKIASGSESGSLNVTAPSAGTVKTRMYRISNPIGGGIKAWSVSATLSGTDASIEMPTIPVRGQAAAVALIAVADDNAVASATGETGGDWTESTAEYADATNDDGCLQLQMSSLVAGPLSGGSQTMAASDPWCVIAFAVRNKRQIKIGTDTASTATSTFSLTVTDHTLLASQFGDPRTVIVVAGCEGATPPTDAAATYEGVAMTKIAYTSNNTDGASMHYLDSASLPADGANTPAISHTGGASAAGVVGRCSQWEGLKQGGPTASDADVVNSNTVVSNDVTAAVADDLIVSLATSDVSTSTLTHSDSQDEIHDTQLAAVMAYATTMLYAAGSETTYSSTSSAMANMAKISAWWSAYTQTLSVTADQGSYSYTGQTVGTSFARPVTVNQGSYAYTGQDVAAVRGKLATVDQGSYALTGQAVGTVRASNATVDQGAYAYTGQAVGTSWARPVSIDAGMYSLTGQDVSALRGRVAAIDQGSYATSGQAVAIGLGRNVALDTGVYALTGYMPRIVVEVPQTWLEPTPEYRRGLALELLRRRQH